ncbi:hypothetical protein ABZP36_032444 [Zizania latifolia]
MCQAWLSKQVVIKSKRIILRKWHTRRLAAAMAVKRGCSEVLADVMKLDELFDIDDNFDGAFGRINNDDGDGWRERCFAVGDGDGV